MRMALRQRRRRRGLKGRWDHRISCGRLAARTWLSSCKKQAEERAGKAQKEVETKGEDEAAEKANAAADLKTARETDQKARIAALDSASDESNQAADEESKTKAAAKTKAMTNHSDYD